MNSGEPQPQCIMIYDGRCRLCTGTKSILERWSPGKRSGIRYVPFESAEAAVLLGDAYKPGRPEVAYLVQPGSKVAEGVDAFLALLPRMPGGKLLASMMELPILYRVASSLYRLVARKRYRWFGASS